MTQEQLRKIRNAGYKFWDKTVFENSDWSKRDVSQFSFEAGARYALANKYDELKEDAEKKNDKPNIVQFLKDNGVYEMFFANLFNQRTEADLSSYFLSCFFNSNAISAAFAWDRTPEGNTFWCEISRKWSKQFDYVVL